MKKVIRQKNSCPTKDLPKQQSQPDLLGLLHKISEQISYLERKVDNLISSQATSRLQDNANTMNSASQRYNDRSRESGFTKAICSDCGKECQLPFKPSGDRPVYCRNCFSSRKRSENSSGKFENKSRDHHSFNRGNSNRSRFDSKRRSFTDRGRS